MTTSEYFPRKSNHVHNQNSTLLRIFLSIPTLMEAISAWIHCFEATKYFKLRNWLPTSRSLCILRCWVFCAAVKFLFRNEVYFIWTRMKHLYIFPIFYAILHLFLWRYGKQSEVKKWWKWDKCVTIFPLLKWSRKRDVRLLAQCFSFGELNALLLLLLKSYIQWLNLLFPNTTDLLLRYGLLTTKPPVQSRVSSCQNRVDEV
jgi:hypothetical protein